MDSFNLFPLGVALVSVTLIEAIQGFALANAHIIRDFLTQALLIGMLLMSYKAAKLSLKNRDHEFNYGYMRVNIMAAFINTVYIMSKSLFGFLDSIHHMIELWELDSHQGT